MISERTMKHEQNRSLQLHGRGIYATLLLLLIMVFFALGSSTIMAGELKLPLYSQDDENNPLETEVQYSLRKELARTGDEHIGFQMLAVNEDVLVYSNDLEEDGFVEFFSHEEKRVIDHFELPGEFVASGALVGDGFLFLHLPRKMLDASLEANAKTQFTISYLGADREITELMQGEVSYHTFLPRLTRVGDSVIFAYGEVSATDLDRPETERISRIGLIGPDLSLRWLLEERQTNDPDPMRFAFSNRSICTFQDRALILFRQGGDSIVFEYSVGTDELSRIFMPDLRISDAFLLGDGHLVLPVSLGGLDPINDYYLVGPDGDVRLANLPADFELVQILPISATENLWFFRTARSQIVLFYGDKTDGFVSDNLLTEIVEVEAKSSSLPPMRGFYQTYQAEGGTYLVVDDFGVQDLRVVRLLQ